MKLSDLLKTVKLLTISGKTDIEIAGINIDSRKIKDGHLFVAIKGTQTDGHRFIPKAIELGATTSIFRSAPGSRWLTCCRDVTTLQQRELFITRHQPMAFLH